MHLPPPFATPALTPFLPPRHAPPLHADTASCLTAFRCAATALLFPPTPCLTAPTSAVIALLPPPTLWHRPLPLPLCSPLLYHLHRYGFLSDSIPLCGYRRRSYLVACGAVAACCWALLAAAPQSTFSATALMTLASGATAFSDVVVDSIVVERSRGAPTETSGSLQSLCWVSNYVGQIASAYFSGFLVDKYGNR